MWARVAVQDYLIQSLICRDGFGLCMMDEIGFSLPNNFIHSREARGREPYLMVDVTGDHRDCRADRRVLLLRQGQRPGSAAVARSASDEGQVGGSPGQSARRRGAVCGSVGL